MGRHEALQDPSSTFRQNLESDPDCVASILKRIANVRQGLLAEAEARTTGSDQLARYTEDLKSYIEANLARNDDPFFAARDAYGRPTHEVPGSGIIEAPYNQPRPFLPHIPSQTGYHHTASTTVPYTPGFIARIRQGQSVSCTVKKYAANINVSVGRRLIIFINGRSRTWSEKKNQKDGHKSAVFYQNAGHCIPGTRRWFYAFCSACLH